MTCCILIPIFKESLSFFLAVPGRLTFQALNKFIALSFFQSQGLNVINGCLRLTSVIHSISIILIIF